MNFWELLEKVFFTGRYVISIAHWLLLCCYCVLCHRRISFIASFFNSLLTSEVIFQQESAKVGSVIVVISVRFVVRCFDACTVCIRLHVISGLYGRLNV